MARTGNVRRGTEDTVNPWGTYPSGTNGGTTPKRTMKVPEINEGTQGKLWKDTV